MKEPKKSRLMFRLVFLSQKNETLFNMTISEKETIKKKPDNVEFTCQQIFGMPVIE